MFSFALRPPLRGGVHPQAAVLAVLFAVGLLLGTWQQAAAADYFRYNNGTGWWRNSGVVITSSAACGYDGTSVYGPNSDPSFGTANEWAGWDSQLPSAANLKVWWFLPSCIGNATNANYRISSNGGSSVNDYFVNQNSYSNVWITFQSSFSVPMNANNANDFSALNAREPGVAANTHQVVWDDTDYETP